MCQCLWPNLVLNLGKAIIQHSPLLELYTVVCPFRALHICAYRVLPNYRDRACRITHVSQEQVKNLPCVTWF